MSLQHTQAQEDGVRLNLNSESEWIHTCHIHALRMSALETYGIIVLVFTNAHWSMAHDHPNGMPSIKAQAGTA